MTTVECVQSSRADGGWQVPPGSSAQALVSEIAVRAARFVATGEGASIDLHCLRALPEERRLLGQLLGKDEVSPAADPLGHSEIRETLVPCVWWIRRRNGEDETPSETIEINVVPAFANNPDLVAGDRWAVVHGLEALRSRMTAVRRPA